MHRPSHLQQTRTHSMATSVFLLGPGFLGGAILALLKLERPQLALSVLVRKPEQAEVLRSIGAQPVLGSLDDADLLQAQAAKSDIVRAFFLLPRGGCGADCR